MVIPVRSTLTDEASKLLFIEIDKYRILHKPELTGLLFLPIHQRPLSNTLG